MSDDSYADLAFLNKSIKASLNAFIRWACFRWEGSKITSQRQVKIKSLVSDLCKVLTVYCPPWFHTFVQSWSWNGVSFKITCYLLLKRLAKCVTNVMDMTECTGWKICDLELRAHLFFSPDAKSNGVKVVSKEAFGSIFQWKGPVETTSLLTSSVGWACKVHSGKMLFCCVCLESRKLSDVLPAFYYCKTAVGYSYVSTIFYLPVFTFMMWTTTCCKKRPGKKGLWKQ